MLLPYVKEYSEYQFEKKNLLQKNVCYDEKKNFNTQKKLFHLNKLFFLQSIIQVVTNCFKSIFRIFFGISEWHNVLNVRRSRKEYFVFVCTVVAVGHKLILNFLCHEAIFVFGIEQ